MLGIDQMMNDNVSYRQFVFIIIPTNFTMLQAIMTQPMLVTSGQLTKEVSASLNDSVSSYESIINDLTPEQSKFYSCFIENWEMFQAHVSSYDVIHTHHLFGSKFVNYRIKVITDHACYCIEKRYRDFEELFQVVSQYYTPSTVFPRKTHFRSKVCPFLTETRKKAFDGFLKELIQLRRSNKSVVSELLKFLDLKMHYDELGLTERIFQLENTVDYLQDEPQLFAHFLRHELLKIQAVPNQSLRCLAKLESLLSSAGRNLIKLDDLRVLLVGKSKLPGLISIALASSNQVVGLTFIKFVKKLLSQQTCPYADLFKRILETSPFHTLIIINEGLLECEKFVEEYFELLSIYLNLRRNQEHSLREQNILKDILKPNFGQSYTQWKNSKKNREFLKRKTTKLHIELKNIQVKLNQKEISEPEKGNSHIKSGSEPNKISNTQDQNDLNADNQFQQQIKFLQSKDLDQHRDYNEIFRDRQNLMRVRDGKFIHFSVLTNKNLTELKAVILKFNHNRLICSYYPAQNLTKLSKMFIALQGKSERFFEFQQQYQENMSLQIPEDQRSIKMILTHSKEVKTHNTFYFYIRAYTLGEGQCKVQIMYYFHLAKIRKIFNNQLTGKNMTMWESICSKLLDKKGTSSFSSVKTAETCQQMDSNQTV